MQGADADAACHHHGHDDEGAGVEEAPEILPLAFEGADAAGVFANEAAEHAPEKHENDDGAERCDDREMAHVGGGADAHDVDAGCQPDKRCQQQQGAFFYHAKPSFKSINTGRCAQSPEVRRHCRRDGSAGKWPARVHSGQRCRA